MRDGFLSEGSVVDSTARVTGLSPDEVRKRWPGMTEHLNGVDAAREFLGNGSPLAEERERLLEAAVAEDARRVLAGWDRHAIGRFTRGARCDQVVHLDPLTACRSLCGNVGPDEATSADRRRVTCSCCLDLMSRDRPNDDMREGLRWMTTTADALQDFAPVSSWREGWLAQFDEYPKTEVLVGGERLKRIGCEPSDRWVEGVRVLELTADKMKSWGASSGVFPSVMVLEMRVRNEFNDRPVERVIDGVRHEVGRTRNPRIVPGRGGDFVVVDIELHPEPVRQVPETTEVFGVPRMKAVMERLNSMEAIKESHLEMAASAMAERAEREFLKGVSEGLPEPGAPWPGNTTVSETCVCDAKSLGGVHHESCPARVVTPACTCPLDLLMTGGCKCGAMAREKR